jgi:putative transposase
VGVLDASTSPPKERYAVSKDNIIKLIQPGNVADQLTEILRNGARVLLAQAVEAEVADFLGKSATSFVNAFRSGLGEVGCQRNTG